MQLLFRCLRALLFAVLILSNPLSFASEYVTYLHPDVQGSPVVATDEQGQVIWRESYAPWGEREIKDAASANVALGSTAWYTGKEEEEDFGLYYYGARWYSPSIGQFYSIDPAPVTLDNPRSFGRYLYANNNPIRYTDPDGRSPIDVAFLAYDIGRLGMAVYSGVGVGAAAADVGMSIVGVLSPVPGTGQILKTARTADRVADAARAGAKGCCCFVAGTPVLTADGLRPIESIQEGTLVPARDPETGQARLQKVTDFIVTEGKPLYALTMRNGNGHAETLQVTDNHPFWVDGQGWVDSAQLKPGMVLQSESEQPLQVVALTSLGRTETTYNLTVEGYHTYFAGEQRVLVHNCSCKVSVGGGAKLENISASDARRIQNAANRSGQEISLVGSRAGGTAKSSSDWDYVTEANSKTRNNLSRSLPGAGDAKEGLRPNLDVFKGVVEKSKPHITFKPEKKR